MNKFFSASRVSGFTLAGVSSVAGGWTLPEFCWSTWLAGMVLFWVAIFFRVVRNILRLRQDKSLYESRLSFLRGISPEMFFAVGSLFWCAVGYLGFYLSCVIFGFYGLFLSVFSEMEPLTLFGRNGFINSDFWTPVVYLGIRFWPMAAGTVLANWRSISATARGSVDAFLSSELTRIHVMVIMMPFLSLAAWAIWGEAYQTPVVLMLMALFYFWPKFFRKPVATASTG